MFANSIKFIPYVLLIVLPHVHATPALKMHVFDEPSAGVITHDTQQPVLNMHVYDNSPTLQNNAVVPDYKQRTSTIKKPVLAYERAEVYFKTGYRRDDLDWTIASISGTPNIISELKWRDIEIATINAGATLYTQANWLVNFDMVYGQIFDGKNQDSDYSGNNRTLEFSRSNNNADQGDVLDLSLAVGYRWQLPFDQQSAYPRSILIPQAGLSYSSQNFKMTDGFQTIPASGSFSGLDSSYDATWFGPWLGLDSQIIFNQDFTLGANIEYHYAFYDATANWNLRSDFAHPESFTHEAEGYGLVGNIEGQLRLDTDLSLNISLSYQDWQADRKGVDTTFFSNGSTLKTGFNGVNWRSFGANIGLLYQF